MMERTNFCDAFAFPVILILNAVVVVVVMRRFASGNHTRYRPSWNVCRTAAAANNYISTDILPVESPNGDSDDPVCDCRNPQDQ